MTIRWFGFHCGMLLAALGLAGAAALAGLGNSPAVAAEVNESVRDILFETDHLVKFEQAAELKYRFERSVSEPKLLGPEFTDNIKIAVSKADGDGKHDVEVQIFSGDRARDTRQLSGMTANPVLVFYLDRAISNFATLGGGNKAYLKNRFRLALRTTAKIEPVKINYNGETVDGHHVWVTPYLNDPNKERMSGYEASRFDVYVSNEVPGYLVELKSQFESSQPGAPKLDERIALEGAGVVK